VYYALQPQLSSLWMWYILIPDAKLIIVLPFGLWNRKSIYHPISQLIPFREGSD
jgi:hypothetical protein